MSQTADIMFQLPYWYDLHTHFRQDETLEATVQDHLKMACAGALAMPNTKPPVGKVFRTDDTPQYKSIEEYYQEIDQAVDGAFDALIIPLYITAHTTAEMIEAGAKSGLLKACKYYPPHGTTGADHGYPFVKFMENGVFKAMEDHGVTLCVHGEEHGLHGEDYFGRHKNAEEIFYQRHMPAVVEKFPKLRIVGEHLTTKVGADFVHQAPDHIKATVTPQHLLYTVADLLKGLKYHLYCLPLVKFDEDRDALQKAVIAEDNTKFFAGTDSAPHTKKATPCGCAAGCYTGGIAPQLYAEAFELSGVDMGSATGQKTFKKFLCTIGQDYYNLPTPSQTFTLYNSPQTIKPLTIGEETIIPLTVGMGGELKWSLKLD